jgi:hypothetical protein
MKNSEEESPSHTNNSLAANRRHKNLLRFLMESETEKKYLQFYWSPSEKVIPGKRRLPTGS